MKYNIIYNMLCLRGQLRKDNNNEYYEKHHILPKCLGGNNDISNLTKLTAREHFIAHWLLCKIYDNTNDMYKLSSAFNKMCCSNKKYDTTKRKLTSYQYEIARREYSRNHPMKNSFVRDKVSKLAIIRGIRTKQAKIDSLPFCQCGCGLKVRFKQSKFLKEHYISVLKGKHESEQQRQKISISLSNTLKHFTPDQMAERLKKSLHGSKVNHVLRGENISKGKKGKKTNQQEIMGNRYANMSDIDFKQYILQCNPWVHTRIINLRNKYLCLSNTSN